MDKMMKIGVAGSDLRLELPRRLLASKSTYFDMRFKLEPQSSDVIVPPHLLPAGDAGFELLKSFEHWLHDESLTFESASKLLAFGDCFGVAALQQHCQEVLLENLRPSTVVHLLTLDAADFQDVLISAVARRPMSLIGDPSSHPSLGEVTHTVLARLLRKVQLLPEEEMFVWEVIAEWLRRQPEAERLDLSYRLVCCVRVGLLPFDDYMRLWTDLIELTGCGNMEFMGRWLDFQAWKHGGSDVDFPMPRMAPWDLECLTLREHASFQRTWEMLHDPVSAIKWPRWKRVSAASRIEPTGSKNTRARHPQNLLLDMRKAHQEMDRNTQYPLFDCLLFPSDLLRLRVSDTLGMTPIEKYRLASGIIERVNLRR